MVAPKRKQPLLLAMFAICLGLLWWRAPDLVGLLIFNEPEIEVSAPSQVADVGNLQRTVAAALPALGVREDQRLEVVTSEQEDRAGSWAAVEERWQLSSDADPLALARRLESLVSAEDSEAEVYVVELDSQQVQIRFYAGSRLATVLRFEPSLESWPSLSRDRQPWLALVVYGVDQDPHGVRQLMEADLPLAVALSPHSPFTLRFSRDALLNHTEVLATSEPDVSLTEALEAVPHASGLLVTCPPGGDPGQQARALHLADMYVLDAVDGGLGGRWLRAFQDAEVPYVRAQNLDPGATDLGRRRFLHAAAKNGAAVLVVHAAMGAAAEEVEQLRIALLRGYRAAFPAEVVERTRK